MSINFSQNPEYAQYYQENFGAGIAPPEAPHSLGMFQSMGLPSNKEEAVKFLPHFVAALGASKLITGLATASTHLKQKYQNGYTGAECFEKSGINKMTQRVDNVFSPFLTKHAKKIESTKSFFSKITPQWAKNVWEKIQIGVTPRNRMALTQYKGITSMQLDSFLDRLKNLPDADIKRLGLEPIIANAGKNTAAAAKQAISLLERLPAQELNALKSAKGKSLKILEELTKSKALLGTNAKTGIGRGLQKGLMMVSEAAGGGVVGGSLFGIIMNSIFLASTFKRTWDAPKGEKLSTFMEGALVDFCGGYLMALLGTKITYKLLGAKNSDKTAHQLKRISQLTDIIKNRKLDHSQTLKALKELKKSGAPAALIKQFEEDIAAKAFKINKSINLLKKMKGFKSRGFKNNLINRPLRWIGNFFSVGLENLPENVVGKTIKKGKIKNISAFRVGWQHIKNSLKTLTGYPVRFFLVLAVVTPPLTKLCAKISHGIFGKPTNSFYDNMHGGGENKNQVQNTPQNPYHVDMNMFNQYTKALGMANAMVEAQQNPQAYQQRMNQPAPQISQRMIEDAINSRYKNRQSHTPQVNDSATYIPSTKSSFQNNGILDISPAKYVPTSIGVGPQKSPLADTINAYAVKADRLSAYIDKELADSKESAFNI